MTNIENEKLESQMNDEIMVPLACSQSFSSNSGILYIRFVYKENYKKLYIFFYIILIR